MQHKSIPILKVTLKDIRLYPKQIRYLRAAVAEAAGMEKDLFHNHRNAVETSEIETDGSATDYHYRYPLIQYRSEGGHAVLFGIGKGASALRTFLLLSGDFLAIGAKKYMLKNMEVFQQTALLQLEEHWHGYRLKDWLALNQEQYQLWKNHPRLRERATLLEKQLTAHVLTFCRDLEWELPGRMELELTDLHHKKWVSIHGSRALAFDVSYRSNLLLPDHIAMGRGVSHGFGVQHPYVNSRANDKGKIAEQISVSGER